MKVTVRDLPNAQDANQRLSPIRLAKPTMISTQLPMPFCYYESA